MRARRFIMCALMNTYVSSLLPTVPSVAVVTGGNRGLGYAIAQRLLHHSDFSVVIASRSLASGQAGASALLSEEMTSSLSGPVEVVRGEKVTAPRVVAMQLDVTCDVSLDAFCAQVLEEHGPTTLLINNAAMCIANSGPNGVVHLDDLQRSIAVNFHGPVKLVQRLYGSGSSISSSESTSAQISSVFTQSRQRKGSVINVSSGDGELTWLNSRLAAALQQCRTPEDVMALASLDVGKSNDAQTDSLASDQSGLLLDLLSSGDELAFGPTPAYAVSKALLNAWARTVGSMQSVVSGPSSDNSECRNSGAATVPTGLSLLCIHTINCVCPGDVVGSNMYSGEASGEANARWHYAKPTEAQNGSSGHSKRCSSDIIAASATEFTEDEDNWDVTLEEAARDVCALIGTKTSGTFFRFGREVNW